MKSNIINFVGGLLLGVLLVGVGLFLGRDAFFPEQIIHTKVIVKKQIKTESPVASVPATPVWKATLYNKDGSVNQSWQIKKCKMVILGALLTDVNGKEIKIKGNNIKIERIK